MNDTDTAPDLASTIRLEADAGTIIGRTREAFVDAIEALCGGDPRAQDVIESFGVHRKLGWQAWNVAYAPDPLLAVRYIPTPRGLEAWIASAAAAGLAPEILDRLRHAATQFEKLVERHAGSRELLEMMVESCEPALDEATEQRWRKQSFSGNSFVFGVRVKTLLAAAFLHPSARAHYFDMARIQGLIGLIRTRPNVRWPFAQSIIQSGEANAERRPQREPLLPCDATAQTGVPLMAAFCSQPAPPVQRRLGELGMLEDELLPGPVGQTGECTIITGEILREIAPPYRSHEGEDAMFGTGVRTPGEVLICDLFVHRDLFSGMERELRVYSELVSPITRDDRDRLPVSERIHKLGRGIARIRTAEVPRYAELVTCVLERTGWKADDFDVFRIRMRHPPLPVSVMFRHELPPPPAGWTP